MLQLMSGLTSSKRTIREFAARSHALQAQRPVQKLQKNGNNHVIKHLHHVHIVKFSTILFYLTSVPAPET
jgi:hypothetical protein